MDDTTGSTRKSEAGGGDDVAATLADMRARLDEAAGDIDRLTTELERRSEALDELEGIADMLLDAMSEAVLVIRADRRVRALSRGAAELLSLDGSHVGKALSSVAPDEVVAATRDHLARLDEAPDGATTPDEVVAGGYRVTVTGLSGGGAVLVLVKK